MGVMCRFALLVLLCAAKSPIALAATTMVDLNGPGCDNLDGYYIENADDIIRVFAQPQYNTQATRDHCDVTIRAASGRRIQYLIDIIKFHECGIELYLYDNPTIDSNPMHLIKCNDNSKVPIQGKTRYNVLRLRLRKTTPESRVFEFSMGMKNDLGPSLDFDILESQYAGQALEPGVIAGIAVAGGIIIIALILLAIYLCIRARNASLKEQYAASSVQGESSVYTSGTSQVIFAPGSQRYPRGKYGSMEDIRSTTSSQDKANGAYSNAAYTTGPGEKGSERQASIGRARGKTGFTNEAYDQDDMGGRNLSWQEREAADLRGSQRQSRRDAYDTNGKKLPKSALKKSNNMEMKPNGILKTRTHSPNRSQTSSTDASLDTNTMIYGYKHLGKDQPNVHHLPVIERRRSRSGTRSHRSGSSTGRGSVGHRRSQSADKKVKNNRMYGDVFMDDERSRRSRSSGRRARSDSSRRARSDRTSDSIDSSSSTTSYSRKVSMNPSGKRVHIKGEETDI